MSLIRPYNLSRRYLLNLHHAVVNMQLMEPQLIYFQIVINV